MAEKVRVTITTVQDIDVMAFPADYYGKDDTTIEKRMAAELANANDDPALYASMDGAETTVKAEIVTGEPRPMLSHENSAKFYESMDIQQIKGAGISWFSLPVTLTASDNTYIKYPANGVIRFCEQGTNLSIIKAVFHALKADGSLGAPVEVKNPVFNFPMSPA